MRHSRLLAMLVIVGMLATVGAASAEISLKNWWEGYFGSAFPGYDIQHNDTWTNSSPEDFVLALQQAGGGSSATYLEIGWYDVTDIGVTEVIFAGSDAPIAQKTVHPGADEFGLYLRMDWSGRASRYQGAIDPTQPWWWYTQDNLNEPAHGVGDNHAGTGPVFVGTEDGVAGAEGRHAYVYDLHQIFTEKPDAWDMRWQYGAWVVAWDDWAGDDANPTSAMYRQTFNDSVVLISKTPGLPPSALLLLTSLPLGLGYIRNRRRKED